MKVETYKYTALMIQKVEVIVTASDEESAWEQAEKIPFKEWDKVGTPSIEDMDVELIDIEVI